MNTQCSQNISDAQISSNNFSSLDRLVDMYEKENKSLVFENAYLSRQLQDLEAELSHYKALVRDF